MPYVKKSVTKRKSIKRKSTKRKSSVRRLFNISSSIRATRSNSAAAAAAAAPGIVIDVDSSLRPDLYNVADVDYKKSMYIKNLSNSIKDIERVGGLDESLKYFDTSMYPGIHLFVQSALIAFTNHFPLELRPDMIFQLILEGLSRHVNMNSEALRSKFVRHEGKDVIKIDRDEFRLGPRTMIGHLAFPSLQIV
jgi:hypothetical protein